MRNNDVILIVGAGYMAIEYAKVLKSLKKEFIVIGRGEKSATTFEKEIGVKVIQGGLDKYLKQNEELPTTAIAAISEDQLGTTTIKLLKRNVNLILVEKPGGLDFSDIKKVYNLSQKKKAKVYIAYNRRFYTSVEKAVQLIKEDGGIQSIFFDFTELDYIVAPLDRPQKVKENWFLQNSTHVVDLAFYLAGHPQKMNNYISGKMSWHKKGATFTGAGVTTKGTLFAYQANWAGPGRWGVEVMTKKHKLIFRPLEKLQVQNVGSFKTEELNLSDKLDTDFKPGIFKEIQSFLGNKKNLCTIEEQMHNLKFYKQILVQ